MVRGCVTAKELMPLALHLAPKSVVSYGSQLACHARPPGADTYYPIGTVQCCTPALLLANGDAWELQRCGCRPSADSDYPVNCGGTHTHELLLGYTSFR
jgi:hypothetical protein